MSSIMRLLFATFFLILGPIGSAHAQEHGLVRDAKYLETLAQIRAEIATSKPEAIVERSRWFSSPLLSTYVRCANAEALGNVKDPRVFDGLRVALQQPDSSEGHREVRRAVAMALVATGDPRTFDALIKMLDDPTLRPYVLQALRALGDPRALEPLWQLYVRERDDLDVQRNAPEIVLALDPKRGLDLLLARCVEGINPLDPITRVLRRRNEPRVRETMHALLAHHQPARRCMAVEVLAYVGDSTSIEPLIELWDRDSQLRRRIVFAFASLRDREAVQFLADELLRAENLGLREDIARALGRIGHPQAAKRLCEAVEDEKDPMLKIRMLEALARVGDERAIATIAGFLEDGSCTPGDPPDTHVPTGFPKSTRVACVAAWALGLLRDGYEPCSIHSVNSLGQPPETFTRQGLENQRQWWREHRLDARYRFLP